MKINSNSHLNESQFLNLIHRHLDYKPDSANYDLYQSFIDILVSDGGDDDFAHDNEFNIAFQLSKQVTLKHIEIYDNDLLEPLDIYILAKHYFLIS